MLPTEQQELPVSSEDDGFDMFEAELGDALWEEALSSGIAERSLERASQEIPQAQSEESDAEVSGEKHLAAVAADDQVEGLPITEPVSESFDVMYGYPVKAF